MKIDKELAMKILGNVENEFSFFCCDGKIVSSLKELGNALMNMSDETFIYHANKEKNDFSNWIRDCFGDIQLAGELVGLDREKSFRKIVSRINYIERYLKKRT